MCTRTKEINHRYHKAKAPEQVLQKPFGGCAILQRISCSIVIQEELFEQVAYCTYDDALSDFLYEPSKEVPHRYHPLT